MECKQELDLKFKLINHAVSELPLGTTSEMNL